MENVITYDERPKLNRPILIEGLPGVGNVGKIAADFISYKLNAKRMATIISSDLPPQVFIDDVSCIFPANNELWYVKDVNGHDLVFLQGEFQSSTAEGQFRLSKFVFDKILPYDPSMIITLGGYGLGSVVSDPRVLGAVTDPKMKSKMEKFGVTFLPHEPQGGIVGAAAMLIMLADEYGIDGMCLMGETSGYIVDSKSAKCVVNVLCKMLGIELDTSEMQEDIDHVDEINDQVQALTQENLGDLSYIR